MSECPPQSPTTAAVMSLNNADAPAEVTVIERCAGRWLRFEELHFTEPNSGQQRSWEYVRRTHNRPDRVDAVEVVSVLRRQGYPDRIVLVTQYRPPIQRYCVEFPAGLVDPEDGTLLDAARREMLEETGYLIDVPEDNESAASAVKLSPTLFYEPGLSNSSVQMVFADINGDLPANQQPNQRLESDEWSLKTLLLPVQGLYESLERLCRERNLAIDAKLYSFAFGLQFK